MKLASVHIRILQLILEIRDEFVKVIEDSISYSGESLQRYSVVYNESTSRGYQNVQFAVAQAKFEELSFVKYIVSIEE